MMTSDDGRSARLVTIVGIGVSAVLACANVFVGWWAHSSSVVATGLEFAGDVLASGIVLAGLRAAAKPADANHPYGHGRFETIAAFLVGAVLLAGGVVIAAQSLRAIGASHDPPGAIALAVLGATIVVRGVMAIVKVRAGRRMRSAALLADGWNDSVDILSALAALTAVALARANPDRFLAADHYGGFLVGVVVVITGARVLRDASFELADTMPDPALIDRVRAVASTVPGVLGTEKLFARKTGFQYHVDLHIGVDPAMTVRASHDIASDVRATLTKELPWIADVLVHVEPFVPQDLLNR